MTEKVVSASRAMALAPSPSVSSMDSFRIWNNCDTKGSRAANGESSSLYGEIGTPVPFNQAAICAEEFDPAEQVIATWLMDPFLEVVCDPFRSILPRLPMVGKRFKNTDRKTRVVGTSTIMTFTKAFMVVMAILLFTAAIFTLQTVKRPKVRIMTMGMFAQIFALPAQFLGPRSLPLYTLVAG